MSVRTFGEAIERPQFGKDAKKIAFLNLNSTATVRILQPTFVSVYTHFVNRASVQCLGDDCPICLNNKSLIMQNPDSFRDEPKYSPRSLRFSVNVLDKTMVKTCGNCGEEIRDASAGATTCKCGSIVTTPAAPSNKVKVLSKGVQLFEQLNAINNAIMDSTGEPVGITNYDVTLVVSGAGKNRSTTPIAGQISGPVEYNPEDLHDLDRATIKLEPYEMLELQSGVSIRDIFAARKASSEKSVNSAVISPETRAEAENAVDALFKGAG